MARFGFYAMDRTVIVLETRQGLIHASVRGIVRPIFIQMGPTSNGYIGLVQVICRLCHRCRFETLGKSVLLRGALVRKQPKLIRLGKSMETSGPIVTT